MNNSKIFLRNGGLNSFCITIFIFLLNAGAVFSQINKIRLEHLSINQGLSQSSVTSLVQDSTGFIWLGTQDGLNRYDGYNFTVYKPIPGDTTSISDNSILCMYVDKKGTLWIGTENGGLDRFDNFTDGFISYKKNPNKKNSISSDCINSITEGYAGNLWLGTYNGLDFFNKSDSKFFVFHHSKNSQSISSDTVYCTLLDSKGNLWIGTQSGLDIYNIKSKTFSHLYNNKFTNSIVSNKIYCLAEDRQNNIWIGTPVGLDKYNPTTKIFTHYKYSAQNKNSISSNYIDVIYIDNNGRVWVGTDNGGLCYQDQGQNGFTRFNNTVIIPIDEIDKQIVSILKDREDNIWLGSFDSGVYRYSTNKGIFGLIDVDFKNLNKLQQNDIGAICEDSEHNLWIGTNYVGLYRYDVQAKRFIHYSHSSSAKSLANNSINTLFLDRRGTIWIGTNKGLDEYYPPSDSFIHYKNIPGNTNSLSNNYVVTMVQDKFNNIWIGTSGGGIDKFDPIRKKFVHYKNMRGNPNSLSSNDILDLFFDNKGILWVGTNGNGLDRFDTETGNFVHYVHNLNDNKGLSHNVVFDIFQFPNDTRGNLWIATGGGGLDELNTRTGKIKFYTELNGLSNNEVYGILGDKNGNLWMSTNHGISEFDLKTKSFHNYDVSDNLQSNEFNQGAFYEDASGKLYFGGIDGLNAFYPDSIKDNYFNPEIVFTSFKDLINPSDKINAIWAKKKIKLPYYDNIISFRFAALSFINSKENHFAYKLEGMNNNWIDNGTSNEVTFSNLPPGNYVLYVRGTNNDGIWSNKTASIKIIIDPPLWATMWFRGIILIIFAALIFLVFRLRVNSIKQQNKKLEDLVNERTKELVDKKEELETVNKKQKELLELLTKSEKDLKELNLNKDKIMSVLAHDLRSPFNGLLGFTDILANDIERLDKEELKQVGQNIHNSATNIFRLLNNLLEWSLVQAGKIKYTPSTENLFQISEEISHLFLGNAAQKSIELLNEINPDILIWADRDMMDIVFRNLISNAIKFTGENGKIKIYSRTIGSFEEVIIQDNGIGISQEDQRKLFNLNNRVSTKGTNNELGSGLGLNLCKELIIKQGGNLTLESIMGKGTSVIFTIPKESTAIK